MHRLSNTINKLLPRLENLYTKISADTAIVFDEVDMPPLHPSFSEAVKYIRDALDELDTELEAKHRRVRGAGRLTLRRTLSSGDRGDLRNCMRGQ